MGASPRVSVFLKLPKFLRRFSNPAVSAAFAKIRSFFRFSLLALLGLDAVTFAGRIWMPAGKATAPHPQRQLGTLATCARIAVGVTQGARAHVGVARRQLPRCQIERDHLAALSRESADTHVVLAMRQHAVDLLTPCRAFIACSLDGQIKSGAVNWARGRHRAAPPKPASNNN